jgi:hypothetical protein
MTKWIDLYTQKCQGIQNLAKTTNTDINEILKNYNTATFPKTNINKQNTFKNALNRTINSQEVQYFNTICELPHKDTRTATQYAVDLILGWITEDITIRYLTNNAITCTMTGTDNERQFLTPSQIDSTPDLSITYENSKPTPLELIYDYTGYWQKTNKLDLRLNKYDNLKTHNALILGIAPQNSTALLLDTTEEHPDITQGAITGYGGKQGYTLHNINQHLEPINEIVELLKDILQ